MLANLPREVQPAAQLQDYWALDGSGFLAATGEGGATLEVTESGRLRNQVGPKRNSTMSSEIKTAYQPEIPAYPSVPSAR